MTHTGIIRFKLRASSVTNTGDAGKKQKLILWPEWNEKDINEEKWEVAGKAVKDSKKPASAPVRFKGDQTR